MSVEEEWAQPKQQPTNSDELRLANAGGDAGSNAGEPGWESTGSSPSDGVKSSKTAWTRAATGVGALPKNISQALTALERGQPGPTSSGVQSAAAQQEVYRSWKRYLRDVSERCAAIQERLEKAGTNQYETDQAIRSAFNKMAQDYEDTPTVGGDKGTGSDQPGQNRDR